MRKDKAQNDTVDIAITGEGPTDYGTREFGGKWLWGPVGVYISKISGQVGKNINLVPVERKEVEARHLLRSLHGLTGKAVPARKFYTIAKERNIDSGIYYCDADKSTGSRNTELDAKRDWKQRYDEVTLGLNNDLDHFIPMIPLRMIENWILADRDALETIGGELGYYFSKKTEMLWGNEDDPKSDYPKWVLSRVCEKMKKKPKVTGRELYVMIADNQQIAELVEKCMVSFAQFYNDLCHLLNLSA